MRQQCIRINKDNLKLIQDAQWYSHELMRIKSGGNPDNPLPRRNITDLEQYDKMLQEFKKRIIENESYIH